MSIQILHPKDAEPLSLIVASHYVSGKTQVEASGNEVILKVQKGKESKTVNGEINALRYLARSNPSSLLPSNDPFVLSEVDGWIDFAYEHQNGSLETVFETLQQHLTFRGVLAGNSISAADIAVWSILKRHAKFEQFASGAGKEHFNVHRWIGYLEAQPQFGSKKVEKEGKLRAENKLNVGHGANYSALELPGAVKGQVITRFPPEPSGYMHLGHCKAALMNEFYAVNFEGKMIVRFDDTNPSKEKVEFVDSIREDIESLGIKPWKITYTSDHFNTLLTYAEKLLKEGKAYIDDSTPEEINKQRETLTESPRRSTSVKENLERWEKMKQGTPEGQTFVYRAKIDPKNPNGVLRDPNLYRVVAEPAHHRTGSKFKVYPLYDFACPIVDSIEGVTHALRSSEYHDRNPLYKWVLDAAGVRQPFIQDFSRLNFSYTLLSKRKLQWIVDKGIVDGWDDPRFPTIRGVFRRGLTVTALREFILGIGPAKSMNLMDMEKLWALNKKVIDPVIPRFTVIADEGLGKVPFHLSNGPSKPEYKTVAKHKKNPDLGTKIVTLTSTVFIEREDADTATPNEEITLMDWGNAIVEKINKNEKGEIVSFNGRLHLEGDYKLTKKKWTWLADSQDLVKVSLVEFDHLITKKKLEENDDISDYVNRNSKFETVALGDMNMRTLKKGDRLQCERRGYWIVDQPYITGSRPLVLFNIPDGHTVKEQSILKSKLPKREEEPEEPKKAEKKKEEGKKDAPKKEEAKKEAPKKDAPKKEEPKKESPAPASGNSSLDDLQKKHTEQGEKVRALKAAKADKAQIEAEVAFLLKIKSQIQELGGTPGGAAPAKPAEQPKKEEPKKEAPKKEEAKKEAPKKEEAKKEAPKKEEPKKEEPKKEEPKKEAAPSSGGSKLDDLQKQHTEQGEKVRALKAAKADKAQVDAEVALLLKIKAQIQELGGTPGGAAPAKPAEQPKKEEPKPSPKKPEQAAQSSPQKKKK